MLLILAACLMYLRLDSSELIQDVAAITFNDKSSHTIGPVTSMGGKDSSS